MWVMSTVKLLWFFLWRMSLLGLLLGALLSGAATTSSWVLASASYVLLEGGAASSLIPRAVWGVAGTLVYGYPGARIGLIVGALDGLRIGLITSIFRRPSANTSAYIKTAGRASAITTASVLLLDWLFHGFPDPYGFALWRTTLPLGVSRSASRTYGTSRIWSMQPCW